MKKIKEILKKDITGWKKWEIVWLLSATLVILGVSIYLNDSIIGIGAALTGIWYVILAGKGKLSCFLFGTVNIILYAIVAAEEKYWGEVMLNIGYYLPANFIGLYVWSKNMDNEKDEVIKKRLSLKNSIIAYGCVLLAMVVYGFFLKKMGGALPFVDSLTTVFSVFAQFLCIKRCVEQWILWIIVDAVSLGMWVYAFINKTGDMATVLMWLVNLICGIMMLVKWLGDVNKREKAA